MKEREANDSRLSALLKQSRLTVPFNDFENGVMRRIKTEKQLKTDRTRSIRLSVFFFLLSTVTGLMINFQLHQSQNLIPGISRNNLVLAFQVFFVVVFLLQLEGLLKASGKFRQ